MPPINRPFEIRIVQTYCRTSTRAPQTAANTLFPAPRFRRPLRRRMPVQFKLNRFKRVLRKSAAISVRARYAMPLFPLKTGQKPC